MERVTIKRAATILGVSRQTVYDAIARGDIKREDIAGHPSIRRSEVDKYNREQKTNGKKRPGPTPKKKAKHK